MNWRRHHAMEENNIFFRIFFERCYADDCIWEREVFCSVIHVY